MDGKAIDLPDGGDYTGACNSHGEKCRDIQIKARGGKLVAAKKSCVILDATLTTADDKPLKTGDVLFPQWSISGFTPSIRVARDFK